MKSLLSAFLTLCMFGSLSASDPKTTITFIDEYLTRWDQFAQGQNEQVLYLRTNKKKFEEDLSALLRSGDKQAVSRLVFYTVVQVGGFIDLDSELGKEATKIFGILPVTEGAKGEKLIFAGDLYFSWEEKKKDFPTFPLYAEWQKREFTQNVAIRMYESARRNSGKK